MHVAHFFRPPAGGDIDVKSIDELDKKEKSVVAEMGV